MVNNGFVQGIRYFLGGFMKVRVFNNFIKNIKRGICYASTITLLSAPAIAKADYYSVSAGDNLKSISERYYGDPNYYDELAEYNGIIYPYNIYANQILDVPDNFDELDCPCQHDYAGDDIVYEFQDGDTLWKVSKIYYGTGNYWELLKDYNKIPDERKIRNGTLIRIPQLNNSNDYQPQNILYSLKEISSKKYGSEVFANTLAAINGVYYMGLYDINAIYAPRPEEVYSYYEQYHSDTYYVVQNGDTLYNIVMRFYGSLDDLHLILGVNNLEPNQKLAEGSVLLIPNHNVKRK